MTPRRRTMRWALAAAACAGALVSVAIYAANKAVLAAAGPRIYRSTADLPERYAIIVLGAAVHGDEPSQVLEDRLATALEVYQSGKGHRFLVSGDHGRKGYDEVRAMHRWLVARGVPDNDIFLDHAGFRTLDTMARAHAVFQVTGAIVVTQEFHLPRALVLAEANGIDAVGIVADRREYEYRANYAVRETFARTMCWLDLHGFGRTPRYLGAPLPITGTAAETRDEANGT